MTQRSLKSGVAVCFAASLAMAQSEARSSAPTVGKVSGHDQRPGIARLTVSWPNSWRNERNHDAVWITLRTDDATKGPVLLAATGHQASSPGSGATVQVAADGTGVFVAPANEHRGDISVDLILNLRDDPGAAMKAWAVGMVYVPAGGFDLGDDDPMALQFGAFHGQRKVDGKLQPAPFAVRDESAIEVANLPGKLWYSTNKQRYPGDQLGPIPAAWPKGTQAFYVMKHELRQGAYAEFLSALPKPWQDARAPLELSGQETDTCTIHRDGDRFVADAPERPCNFVSWDDTCAYLDWLSLRPMTEFEFEKAARGPRRPVAGDFPWGTDSDKDLQRTVQKTRDLAHSSVADEAGLTDANKAEHGASFYWVMDLSGSVWERCISAGHPIGRAFVGSHGDGVLAGDGTATNSDWPKTDGRDAHGIGYRGGAEYFGPKVPDNLTNPHSPVAFRTYGGWGGSYRYKTYSARGCRSIAIGKEVMSTDTAERIRKELAARVEKDQAVRGKFGLRMTDEERRAIAEEAGTIDRDNTVWMQELVHRYGWPTTAMLGKRGSQNAFLLVQHADQAPAFQAMCLPLLEQAVAAGEASATGFAYLTDRVRVKQQRPQLYGTQYHSAADDKGVSLKNDDGGFVYLTPIVEDPDNLDARRKKAGLGPWSDYEARMASLQGRKPEAQPRKWNGKLPVHPHRR